MNALGLLRSALELIREDPDLSVQSAVGLAANRSEATDELRAEALDTINVFRELSRHCEI